MTYNTFRRASGTQSELDRYKLFLSLINHPRDYHYYLLLNKYLLSTFYVSHVFSEFSNEQDQRGPKVQEADMRGEWGEKSE